MPVRLNTILGPKMYPVSPSYIKWGSMLVLLLTVGVAITSLFASDELVKIASISGAWPAAYQY